MNTECRMSKSAGWFERSEPQQLNKNIKLKKNKEKENEKEKDIS